MEHTTQSKKLSHPTPLTYLKIAVLLAVITAVEVAVFYVDFLRSSIVPILFVLSAVKFVLVAMFYMHLRYDNRLFSALFVGGFLLSTIVIIALLGIFQTFRTSTSSAENGTIEVSSEAIHEDDHATQKH